MKHMASQILMADLAQLTRNETLRTKTPRERLNTTQSHHNFEVLGPVPGSVPVNTSCSWRLTLPSAGTNHKGMTHEEQSDRAKSAKSERMLVNNAGTRPSVLSTEMRCMCRWQRPQVKTRQE